MRLRCILLALLGGFALSLMTTTTVQACRLNWFFDKNTNLEFCEERIAGISDEFVRRSPRMNAVWEKFKDCIASPACDPAPILARRDTVVREEWPVVFDRFLVFSDWGEATNSAASHRAFLEAIKKYGAEELRDRCVPIITFRWRLYGGRKVAEHDNEGYACPEPPGPPGQG
jgi:hypothetical protein